MLSRAAWKLTALSIGLPLAVFVALRPDWYFQENTLDPYFYTGYAQNLGDVVAISRQIHYFVSRWTLYAPNRLFYRLFGPERGYLLLRWIAASIISACVIALGRRFWRSWDTAALCVFALISPMLLRTVLTDYSDAVTVPLGIVAICVASLHPDCRLTAGVVGVCAASIAIANPVAGTVVIWLIPGWLWAVRSWRRRTELAGIAVGAGVVVVLFGWAFFRYRYGLSNLYKPTFEFLSKNASLDDPLKSPRLWWMGYRIWIYLPLIVLAAWWHLAARGEVVFATAERTILTTCAFQYGFQIWFQFGRHGSTLEIPYYWSLMVPALLLSVVVVAGKLARQAHHLALTTTVAALVVGVLVWRHETPEIYSSWLDALIVVGGAGYVWYRFPQRTQRFAACALLVVVFTFQVGAPRPEPALPGERRVEQLYDRVFDESGSAGVDGYRAATWFSDQLKVLGRDRLRATYFWVGGGHAAQMAAMYSAHISGHLMTATPGEEDSFGLNRDFTYAVEHEQINVVAMLGSPSDIAIMMKNLATLRPGFEVIFDDVAPDRLHTHVRIVEYGRG